MRKRKYYPYQIYSMILCALILFAALAFPWVNTAGERLYLPELLAGILQKGGVTAFYTGRVPELSAAVYCRSEEGLGATMIVVTVGYAVQLVMLLFYAYYLFQLFRGTGDDTLILWIWVLGVSCSWGFFIGRFFVNYQIWRYIVPLPSQFVVSGGVLAEFFGRRVLMENGENADKERERLLAMEVRNELLERNYREILELTRQSCTVIHDFKNDVNILRQYARNGEMEKIRTYLDEIGTPVLSLESFVWTGNEMLDLILNYKRKEAKEKGIAFTVEAEQTGRIALTDREVCSLFGNLLDNAIEACVKAQEQVQERECGIAVELARHNQILQLQVTNTAAELPRRRGRRFLTGKADGAWHGIGLANVEAIVERHGGDMQIRYDEREFSVCITFFG